MTIEFKTRYINYSAGDHFDCPADVAAKLIAKGIAVAVTEKTKTATPAQSEKAIDDLNTKELKVKGRSKK